MTERKGKGALLKIKGLKGVGSLLSALLTLLWLTGGLQDAKAKVADTLGSVASQLHLGTSIGLSSTAPVADTASGTGEYSSDPNTLSVAAQGSMKTYSRARFGQSWTDDVDGVSGGHNGCDTRNDILSRDLVDTDVVNGCKAMSGTLADPYTGTVIEFHRGSTTSSAVQIDHVVPLGNVWVSGAASWPLAKLKAIANDPMNLLAVDGSTNMSKSDKNAAEWLPPNPAFRCTYVKAQVQVKNRYRLTVTEPEKQVMLSYYGRC